MEQEKDTKRTPYRPSTHPLPSLSISHYLSLSFSSPPRPSYGGARGTAPPRPSRTLPRAPALWRLGLEGRDWGEGDHLEGDK